MTIQTKHNFGETVGDLKDKIRGIHIYVSENGVQTERYFLGNEQWVTIKNETPKAGEE